MRVSTLKATGFAVGVIVFFTYFSFYVDSLTGVTERESHGGIDAETGENLYWGDGQCSTCHKIGNQGSATRGPDQRGFYLTAAKAAKERGLSSPTEYIIESIIDPSAYIVKGYGDIMPKVYEPPIVMDKDQILAITMYLQSLGGEPDLAEIMKYKDRIPEASKKVVKQWRTPTPVNPKVGEEIFFSDIHTASCAKCHRVKGKGIKIGPDLDNIGAIQTPEYIINAILNPSTEIVKGYETVLLITTDGVPFMGIIVEENDEEVFLAVKEGGVIEEYAFYRDEIQELKKQEISMMPGNFGELLNVIDFYGVVNYLLTLK